MKKIAYIGIDYHQNSLTIAVRVQDKKKIDETVRIRNEDKIIRKYMKKLSERFAIRACYEASCSGYYFQRKMKSWGYDCEIIAPSSLPKKRGDRRKNDFRDAQNLAQNYANGTLSIVHLPTEEEESIRSLIRCRSAFKETEKKAKHQINSLLLSQGLRWPRSKWTFQHRKWLWELRMPNEYLQQVLDEHLAHLDYLQTRIKYLDQQIEQVAESDLYAPAVKKLRAFKGIGILSAMLFITEITDFRRFPNPRALMAFLGLIPSENSSGDKQRGGSITKTGNSRCRTQLIECVQHYVKKPQISYLMKADLSQVDPHSAAIAVKCLKRLHKRYWALNMKGKIRPIAITAIAREFVGYIWAMMQPEPVAN
ncbi:MAG: IS110 family transposase [Deltaproteobacteria bacterium]|nr:IS110 family transposase [Deltaproteobacteria bacterium]MBW2119494.1 IS110 family transposase [Deltaproteobacteria bacterium]